MGPVDYRSLAERIPPDAPHRVREVIEGFADSLLRGARILLLQPGSQHPYGWGDGYGSPTMTLLLTVVGGVSRVLFDPSECYRSGEAFKRCLADYFPWELEPESAPWNGRETLTGMEAATVLYESFRNPFQHALGIIPNPTLRPNAFVVSRLGNPTDAEISAMDSWETRPSFWATVERRTDATIIRANSLYWGVREMILRLTQQQSLMSEAAKSL
jgi:hypothetical protein